MTTEQRNDLRAALKDVHDRVHELYPRGQEAADSAAKDLRNRLLIIDLAVHLADEVIGESGIDREKVVERAANLLYGIRLVAPDRDLEKAAELLLATQNENEI